MNDDLEQEQSRIMQDLGAKMMKIVEEYANQNAYAVVLDVSTRKPMCCGPLLPRTSRPISSVFTTRPIRTRKLRSRPPRRQRQPRSRKTARANLILSHGALAKHRQRRPRRYRSGGAFP